MSWNRALYNCGSLKSVDISGWSPGRGLFPSGVEVYNTFYCESSSCSSSIERPSNFFFANDSSLMDDVTLGSLR